jgi:hypothetical protein
MKQHKHHYSFWLVLLLGGVLLGAPVAQAQVDPDPNLVTPKNLVVTGRVGGLVAGPIEPAPAAPADDGDDEEGTVEEGPINFTVFPVGSDGEYRRVTGDDQARPATVFSGNSGPGFFGTASVRGGTVSLQFSFGDFTYGASTRVGADGNWQWNSPKSFPNGNYTVVVKLLDPFTFKELARQSIEFAQVNSGTVDMWRLVPLLEDGQQTTDIIVTPVSGYETVILGSIAKARIHLFGFVQNQDILLEYIVLGPNGEVYLRQTESLEGRTSETFVKPFFTKEDLTPGKYLLLVRAIAGNQVALGSSVFYFEENKGKGEESPNPAGTIGQSIHPALLAVFALILIFDLFFFIFLFQNTRLTWWHRFLFVTNNAAILVLFVVLWKGSLTGGW